MEWVVLLVIIILLGALAGGNSFGETIRTGCRRLGVIIVIVIVIVILFVLALMAGALD